MDACSKLTRNSLVAVVLATFVIHSGLESRINPSDTPKLTVLRSFPASDDKIIDIAEHIGTSYEAFGICILDDELGTTLAGIKYSHQNLNSMLNEIFRRWLLGSGKRPETWSVFVHCLRVANLHVLADTIEKQYMSKTKSTHTNQPTESSVQKASKTPTSPTPVSQSTEAKAPVMSRAQLTPESQTTDSVDKATPTSISQATEPEALVSPSSNSKSKSLGITPQPSNLNHHKIKTFSDLRYAVLRVSSDDWEVFCRGLNIDDAKHQKLNSNKLEFCLRNYFERGIASWEGVIKAVASSPLNMVVTAKQIANRYGIDYYAAIDQENPATLFTMQQQNHHRIKKLNDFQYAMLRVSTEDWEALCRALNVDKETLADLKRWTNSDNDKKQFCLEDYLKYGPATWEGAIKAVANGPLNLVVTAKRIANSYSVDYYAAVGQENPMVSYKVSPNHQKIKKLSDLVYEVLRVSTEDWEALCRALNVDKETLADLKHWTNTDGDKKQFCLVDYLKYGPGTWEGVINAVAGDPLNLIVTAKRIANGYSIDYYTAVGQKNPATLYSVEPNHKKIKKLDDLVYEVLRVSTEDWEALCRALNVDKETLADLKRWTNTDGDKKQFCLVDYLKYGPGTWEGVIKAVASDPLNLIVTAKRIANQYGIDYYVAVGQTNPKLSHPAQPRHHKIKKFDDLRYAVLNIPYEDWEDFCRLLKVDEGTVTDLKRWGRESEKLQFCLLDYFMYGVATWEDLVQAVAASPLNRIVTAKVIANKYGISFHDAMGMDLPMRSSQQNEHRVRKVDDLRHALLKIPYEDWEVVCNQLNIDEPTITDLKRWPENNSRKLEFCLQDYLDTGMATWEHVVYAVASEPLNEVALAMKIARDYAVSYKAVMDRKEIKDEL